jgi:hypothetical protein
MNANGSFVYVGRTAGTDTFTFKANDGSLDSIVATVTVTISEAPSVPSGPPPFVPVLTISAPVAETRESSVVVSGTANPGHSVCDGPVARGIGPDQTSLAPNGRRPQDSEAGPKYASYLPGFPCTDDLSGFGMPFPGHGQALKSSVHAFPGCGHAKLTRARGGGRNYSGALRAPATGLHSRAPRTGHGRDGEARPGGPAPGEARCQAPALGPSMQGVALVLHARMT